MLSVCINYSWSPWHTIIITAIQKAESGETFQLSSLVSGQPGQLIKTCLEGKTAKDHGNLTGQR